MWRNYAITALRNLARNRLYAAINIAGLALGFTAALLIALFVRDEFSYDTWIPGYQRTFLVTETTKVSGHAAWESDIVPVDLAEQLKLDLPAIESIARLVPASGSLRYGEFEANETIWWADPEIFDVLSLPVAAGDLRGALDHPDGLVLTERMARKYFGDANPIGATIEIDRKTSMHVVAVLRDLPSNTHLTTEIFASARAASSALTSIMANLRQGWWESGYIYVRLTPDASTAQLARDLPNFLIRHASDLLKVQQTNLWLTPVNEVHLRRVTGSAAMKPTSNPMVAYTLASIGLLVVAMAGMNFVNLMTARATRRALEVGVRKSTGATRRHLLVQFLGEAIIYAGLSAVLAIVALNALLPKYNAFLGRAIEFDYWRDVRLGGGIIGFVVVVGVLAGFYPALVLSSFRPAAVLKSIETSRSGSGRLRKSLVLAQFAILIGLTIGVGVIYRQVSFALKDGLRLDQDQVVLVNTQCRNGFSDRVRLLSGVRAAACSRDNGASYSDLISSAPFSRAGGERVFIGQASVDFGYFELYGLRPLAGRFFSAEFGADTVPPKFVNLLTSSANVVINEAAARQLGFASPAAAVGQTIAMAPRGRNPGPPLEVIGVVPNFSFDTIHDLISPELYFRNPQVFNWLNVKLTGHDLPETIRAIDALWKEVGDPRPLARLFLDQEVEKLYADIERQSQLFGAFMIVALLIAALGLFGLSAFAAESRTKEIGIRKALGASRVEILHLLLWQFAKPVLWANLIAWPAAYFIMHRWLEGFAYHIDLAPWMFLAASALALTIAVLTVIGHALLVARAKPVAALRYE